MRREKKKEREGEVSTYEAGARYQTSKKHFRSESCSRHQLAPHGPGGTVQSSFSQISDPQNHKQNKMIVLSH